MLLFNYRFNKKKQLQLKTSSSSVNGLSTALTKTQRLLVNTTKTSPAYNYRVKIKQKCLIRLSSKASIPEWWKATFQLSCSEFVISSSQVITRGRLEFATLLNELVVAVQLSTPHDILLVGLFTSTRLLQVAQVHLLDILLDAPLFLGRQFSLHVFLDVVADIQLAGLHADGVLWWLLKAVDGLGVRQRWQSAQSQEDEERRKLKKKRETTGVTC